MTDGVCANFSSLSGPCEWALEWAGLLPVLAVIGAGGAAIIPKRFWNPVGAEIDETRAALDTGSERAIARRMQRLDARGFHERYVLVLQGGLNWLTGIIREDRRPAEAREPGPGWAAPPALTGYSLLFTIGLSTLYTLLFVFGGWVVSGVGVIGGMPIFSNDAPRWLRSIYIVSYGVSLWLGLDAMRDARANIVIQGLLKLFGAGIFFLIPAFLSYDSYITVFTAVSTLSVLTVFSLCFAIGVGGTGATASTVAGVGTIGSFIGFTVAGLFALLSAFAVALNNAMTGAHSIYVALGGVLAFFIALSFALAGAFKGALIGAAVTFVLSERHVKNMSLPGVWALAMISAVLAAFWFDGASESFAFDAGGAALLVFLSLLPALNGLADWLSLSASRALFNRLANGRAAFWLSAAFALLDLILAALFLFLVSVLCVGGVGLAEWLHARGGAAPLIDARAIVDSIRDAPAAARNWWVYLMLGTTLVPTLIHLIAALVALVGLLPFIFGDRAKIIRLLEEAHTDSDKRRDAARAYAWFAAGPTMATYMLLICAVAAMLFWPGVAAMNGALSVVGSCLLASAYWTLDLIGV